MELVEECVKRNYAYACFDFSGNGHSTGEYVSLGWNEALDLNNIVEFLVKEVKCKNIALWGRSMGASASIFYLSD